MSVQTVCLGWHWLPYRYSRTADDVDGSPVTPMPELAGRAGPARACRRLRRPAPPPTTPTPRWSTSTTTPRGWACTRTRRSARTRPVVSLSIGDSCVFRFGNTETRGQPYTDIELRSGDLFVFGGPARFAYHGVPKVLPGTADPACGMEAGRLNLTLRETGLEG